MEEQAYDSLNIYFILSFKRNTYLGSYNIHLSPSDKIKIVKKDLIAINKGNNYYYANLENTELLDGKDIYLISVKFEKIDKNIKDFKIKLKEFFNYNLVSNNTFSIEEIKKNIFIYNISFKIEEIFGKIKHFFKEDINDFLENKFRINNLTKISNF